MRNAQVPPWGGLLGMKGSRFPQRWAGTGLGACTELLWGGFGVTLGWFCYVMKGWFWEGPRFGSPCCLQRVFAHKGLYRGGIPEPPSLDLPQTFAAKWPACVSVNSRARKTQFYASKLSGRWQLCQLLKTLLLTSAGIPGSSPRCLQSCTLGSSSPARASGLCS